MKRGKFYSKMIKEFAKNILFNFKKNKYTFNPVFIIGCGRSGTTILGNTLSNHPKIKYLNERRDLWHKAYPEFDIWSGKIEKGGVLVNVIEVRNPNPIDPDRRNENNESRIGPNRK